VAWMRPSRAWPRWCNPLLGTGHVGGWPLLEAVNVIYREVNCQSRQELDYLYA
jgi:hypothetical protein